jgi:diguanylate cyclase (GGDEF)-like protein
MEKPLHLPGPALDSLLPMHVLIAPGGRIIRAGPTIRKLQPQAPLVGSPVLEAFEFLRPRADLRTMEELREIAGRKLHLRLRQAPQTTLKGVVVEAGPEEGLLLNLSFGISVVEAVGEFSLTINDFAATDLAVEMLYLVEAKSAVFEESRRLNARLQRARRQAEKQALTDSLTGLANRREMERVMRELSECGVPFGLMHLDLDHFKKVNDTLGHAAGDHVLQAVAAILRSETRREDLVARVGGDEFVLIFRHLTDRARLCAIAERIVRRLESPIEFQGRECRVSGSIGITTSGFYATPDPDRMLCDADRALYASKNAGRGRATVAGECPPGRQDPGPARMEPQRNRPGVS